MKGMLKEIIAPQMIHKGQKINSNLLKNLKFDHLEGEFKNIKPTSFDEESKTEEEAEAWLLDIKK